MKTLGQCMGCKLTSEIFKLCVRNMVNFVNNFFGKRVVGWWMVDERIGAKKDSELLCVGIFQRNQCFS